MAGFTEKAIKESFMKLLAEQPLAKISVKSIVEDCGINRNSFYYHFQDIPSLIEQIIREASDALIAKYPNITSVDECFMAALTFTLQNKKAVLHIYNSVNRDIYEKYLMESCDYIVSTYIKTAFGENEISESDRKMVVKFLKYGLFGASIEWVEEGMPDNIMDDIHKLLRVCRGLSGDIIERFKAAEGK